VSDCVTAGEQSNVRLNVLQHGSLSGLVSAGIMRPFVEVAEMKERFVQGFPDLKPQEAFDAIARNFSHGHEMDGVHRVRCLHFDRSR
jgi:hypothetical protein